MIKCSMNLEYQGRKIQWKDDLVLSLEKANLLKEIIGFKQDNILFDLHQNPNPMKEIELVNIDSLEGHEIFRHTLAHTSAQAIKRILGKVEFAIGPVTENGFYYDFKSDRNISEKDFPIIQEEILKIINSAYKVKRKVTTKEDFLSDYYDSLKEEVLKNIEKDITTYEQEDFIDLCSGPHVLNTSLIPKYFKITGISEVTWHNKRLQRLVGVSFATEEQLKEYERKKQEQIDFDHRQLGKRMDLFSFSEMSQGCALWHPKGVQLLKKIKAVIYEYFQKDYLEIQSPEIWKNDLWKKTGHWDNYKEKMFCCGKEDKEGFKPMSCPAHGLFFNSKTRSYKDLPFRVLEFGDVFRNEDTGGLMGLKRVRRMTQDDGHIFCSLEQVKEEVKILIKKTIEILNKFGFNNLSFRLATKPENYIGNQSSWILAENSLKEALEESNLEYFIDEGEGAFYGPKIEVHLVDSSERMWQCSTIQLDFNLAERLGCKYVDNNSFSVFPIVIHRAIVGSLERFVALLLEHHRGLPFFLHPNPIGIIPIKEDEYGNFIQQELKNKGINSIVFSGETIGKGLKKCSVDLIPIVLIVGKKERENNIVSIKENGEQFEITLEKFIQNCSKKNSIFNKFCDYKNN